MLKAKNGNKMYISDLLKIAKKLWFIYKYYKM